MNIRKYAAIAILAALPLNLAACTTTTDTKPTVSATPTKTVDEREVVAGVTQKFFNHFLTLSTTNQNKLADSVPKAAFDIDAEGNLTVTEAKAKEYVKTLRGIDPELAVIDSSGYTAKQTLLVYASFISLASYIENANVQVDASQIVVNGDTATVPGTALTYQVDGETQTGSTASAEGTLHKVNGKWLIAPTISGN